MKLLLVTAIFFTAIPSWSAETYEFDLLPASGTIAGAPGETVGWGYSLQNNSTSYWLVTTALDSGSFQFGAPNLVFDFPILAPGSSVTRPFNAGASTGLLGLTWDMSAMPGTVEVGNFLLNAEWWNGDPLAGGSFAFTASPATVAYQADVAVPEPGTGALLGLALIAARVATRLRA